jgi:hypothetical protein
MGNEAVPPTVDTHEDATQRKLSQRLYLARLAGQADLAVLESDEMWR